MAEHLRPLARVRPALAALLALPLLVVLPAAPRVAADGSGAPADSAAEVARNLALGGAHTCMIDGAGDVACWGDNEFGQLGRNDFQQPESPYDRSLVEMPVGQPAVQVVAGTSHTCAVLAGGEVACWGANDRSQTGMVGLALPIPPAPTAFPSPDKLVVLPGGADASEIAAGEDHTCAILETGAVSCWGDNSSGQLGVATAATASPPSTAIVFPGDRVAMAIDGGADHTCALLDDGTVSCWGANDRLQSLGADGDLTGPTPPQLILGQPAVAIGAADGWSCAQFADDTLACWGRPDPGAAATGPAVLETFGTPITSFSIGGEAACFTVDRPDAPVCSGDNFFGQLGAAINAQRVDLDDLWDVVLPDDFDVDTVVVGGDHACAIRVTGQVLCWGRNDRGQLGFDTGGLRSWRPVSLVGTPLDGVTQIAAGSDQVCAVRAADEVRCWGTDEAAVGIPGYDTGLPFAGSTLTLPTGRTVEQIESFADTTCVLLDDGSVACWGDNSQNQAGQASTGDVATPTTVPFLTTLTTTQIAVGASHACALRTDPIALLDDRIVCWGSNNSGQLGTNGNGQLALQVAQLPAGTTPTSVTAGGAHTCALLDDDTATCWGENFDGQLGDGTTNDASTGTTRVASVGFPITRIDAGGQHTCVKTTDGSNSSNGTACFGSNSSGRLGTGDEVDNLTIDEFLGLSSFTTLRELDAGREHTCTRSSLLFNPSVLHCFGPNSFGQLGDGATNSSNAIGTAVSLPAESGQVSLATNLTCVLLVDTTVTCFGDNQAGRLGVGVADSDSFASGLPRLRVLGSLATVGPVAFPAVATVPAAPTGVSTKAGNARATVSWSTPGDDGGAPITRYTVTSSPGGKTCTTTGATTCTVTGLTNGTSYTFRVIATNRRGNSTPSAPSAAITPTATTPPPSDPGEAITPMDPARYWDTRDEPTFDDQFTNTGRLNDNDTHTISIAGRGDVPTDATGIVANLTVIFPDGPGFATIYPCTPAVPNASTINYGPGDVIANNTIVPLDTNGNICVFTLRGAEFALDINGYTADNSPIIGVNPARYLDTRPTEDTFDNQALGAGRTTDNDIIEVQIAGRGTIPANATAAIINATIIFPDGPGFATLYPCGDIPGSSNINYTPGTVTPNGAITQLSPTGTLCIFTLRSADIIIDVSGYIPNGVDSLTTRSPDRFLDTRPGEPTVDGQAAGQGPNQAGEFIEVQIAGRAGIPNTATAAIINLGIVLPDGPGFATLYPCGKRPGTSNLNHTTAGIVRANNAITRLSPTGTVCIYTLATAHLILDITGHLE